MKKKFLSIIVFFLSLSLFVCSCGVGSSCEHKSKEFVVIQPSTCEVSGIGQNCCTICGEIINEVEISKKTHNYQVDEQASVAVTCVTNGVTIMRCVNCNDVKQQEVVATGHSIGKNTVRSCLKEYNAGEGYASFYESCSNCGEKTNTTFEINISSQEKYTPTSPTVTFYETMEKLSYGFTWNCQAKPLDMGIMISENNVDWSYFGASVVEDVTYSPDEVETNLYVCKTVVELKPSVEYKYKLVENVLGIESETFSFVSANPKSSTFSFASFSDSQNVDEDGSLLNSILSKTTNVDFYIHSGDICENTKIEKNWENMLNENRLYFASKPLMIASGNHDTTYKSGSNVLYKHFNNNIPSQVGNTENGYFYSFVYGNTKFIMINTNVLNLGYLTSSQYDWLVEELSNNSSQWTIVTMHHPLYSVGRYGNSTEREDQKTRTLALRTQLNDIFVEYGVDLVLQGHDHNVSKTYPIANGSMVKTSDKQLKNGILYEVNPQGVIYIMNGPAGNQTRTPESNIETEFYETFMASKAQSWAEYVVTDTTITVSVKYLQGSEVKEYFSWGILKEI